MRNIVILIFIFGLILYGCNAFEAGSNNSKAEPYYINASRDNVIKAINQFKNEYPEYCPAIGFKLKDGYDIDTDGKNITTFYHVYYFNPQDSIYFITWITQDDNKSIISLVSIQISNGSIFTVNDNLKGAKNDSVKNEFATLIVNPIKKTLSGQ